jgi:hypothetical protein
MKVHHFLDNFGNFFLNLKICTAAAHALKKKIYYFSPGKN